MPLAAFALQVILLELGILTIAIKRLATLLINASVSEHLEKISSFIERGNSVLIGYARVSTKEQETYLQIDALNKVGVTRIYQEKASAVSARPQLQKCLSSLKPGDILVVYKMDRVARSLKDLLAILESVQSAGAHIRSLTEPLDTSVPVGIFMVQVLGAVAQLERSIIRERALAGQIAAYNRGVRWGGSRGKLTDIEQIELRQLN